MLTFVIKVLNFALELMTGKGSWMAFYSFRWEGKKVYRKCKEER